MHADSLLLALSRVLRDDWRKSIDLTTNIIYVFFCFSTFSNFHKMLTRHKVRINCFYLDNNYTIHVDIIVDVVFLVKIVGHV